MTPTTLAAGGSPASREAAIAARLDGAETALILEGLPDAANALTEASGLRIMRIAPGCPCCVGNLTLRVMLNRVLRQPPQRLYIGLASIEHVDRLRAFLSAPPYDKLLALTQDLSV